MLYQNCRYLPIHCFNEINITGDLTFLIEERNTLSEKDIKKKYPEDLLQKKWEEIIQEYEKLAKNKKSAYLYSLRAEIIYLQYRIIFFASAQELIELGEDVSQMIHPLKKQQIKPMLASAKNNLNTKLKQLDKETDNKESDVQDFEKALAVVKGNGYSVDRFTLPVSEWIEILNNLERKAEALKKNKKKGS